MRRLATAILLGSVLALAGCIGNEADDEGVEAASTADADLGGHELNFTEPKLIDDTRAGGEPVIAVTDRGTILVSAHPGSTHYHPSDETGHVGREFVQPTNGQSYLWRSTDDGEDFEHVGTPGAEGKGPRGGGLGVSDPDFTVDGDRVYKTDLEALASASVSWSDDDGRTWIEGNPLASQGAVDRQWVASHDGTVYFTANYFSPPFERRVMASEDGLAWQQVGTIPDGCGGDFVASPHDGTMFAGCGTGVAVSEDGTGQWDQRMVPGADSNSSFFMTEPAVDGAGNVWMAWEENETTLMLAGSPDNGQTWPWVHNITDSVTHAIGSEEDLTMVWPWVSAGSEGRVAVSVYASPTPPPSDSGPTDRTWSVVSVAAMAADTNASPAAHGYEVKEGPHVGPICQSGTFCQVNSLQGNENSDRRLGDFFETTIDDEGDLHIVYSDTTAYPDDVVSHPGYIQQTGGPSFVAEDSDYEPTQG